MWFCYNILFVSDKILHRGQSSDNVLNTGVYNLGLFLCLHVRPNVNVANLRSSILGISNLVTT